jgi:hypothetical protein
VNRGLSRGDEGMTVDELPEPIRQWIKRQEEHKDPPVRSSFESLGNGCFEDDWAVDGLPVPGLLYRFRGGPWVAEVWAEEALWVVRPWQRLRCRVSNAVQRVGSFRAALDLLAQRRPWWRYWG